MTRKLRKAVAFLLIAVLFVQQCSVVSLAGEGEVVEEQEEVPDQELPEPEVTEPEPSETPAPETPAPETPATEPQTTEAPVPETQAPETAVPETQAAETQADTAESEEKAETEAEPESETETESESETERSDRENTGDPVTGSDLAAMLSSALPYLFVTKDLSFPADEEEPSIPEDWILDGDDGSEVVSDLKSTATILANATSSFDVTVINLYADENGSLDTAQLDAIFPDHVIDVTNTYYLVNVIADSQTQELSFSGFTMKEDEQTLTYTEGTKPGTVLYNFAVYDENSYQDYTGTLHLSDGFQGTVLAPAASVRVEGDLSGAAYADQVKVNDATADLMKIVFYEGLEEETETESETEEIQTEVFTETETEVLEEEESEIDAEAVPEPMSAIKPLDGERTITVTAQVAYENTPLIPVEDIDNGYYVALYVKNADDDQGDYIRVEDVDPKPLEFKADVEEGSCELTYQSLNDSQVYYVFATDETGERVVDKTLSVDPYQVEFTDDGSGTAQLEYVYSEDWGGLFYYPVSLTIEVSLRGHKGEEYTAEDETFTFKVYDEEKTEEVEAKVQVKNDNTASNEIELKATASEQKFYIEETSNNLAFTILDFDSDITVTCGEGDPVSVTAKVKYKLNDTVVKLSIIGEDTGKTLSGATFIIVQKNDDGTLKKVAGPYSGSETLTNYSKLEEDGETTYYLYEIDAPNGYTPSPRVSFTVKPGLTTEVVTENSKTTSSKYTLTVSKSAYVEDIPVYAYGTTDPVYFALFSNSSHTKKVSNVQKLTMSGYTGTLTFSNLTNGETYYVAETDEYGIALSSANSHQIEYTNGTTSKKTTKMEITKTSQTMSVENIYTSLPSGYRYAVNLTIKKNVTDSSGRNPLAVSETFYAGLFRKSDYSDTPIIISLNCNNSSSASASRRVLLSGEDSVTYYIAEVDANGNRITDSSDFGYYPSDPQTVTLTKEDVKNGKSVTLTNSAKESNKVTLTLSKRVYEGSDPLPVDETFYVGLFKDENLTTPYTSPIAMSLSDADSLTLKLTLNIGEKTDATVYIAEVDASGNLVQSSKEFGYSCYVANNKVVFSQSRKSAQSVLINFVYGTDTQDAINSVLGDLGEYFGDEDFTFDENGDFYGDGSVDTGDTTPIAGCAAVMAASLLIFALSCRRRRRAR